MLRLGRVRQEITMLMHGATLRGHVGPQRGQGPFQPGPAVDNEELGRAEAAGEQVVEDAAPRRFAFPSHVAYGQEQLLPVAAHAEDDQQRDVGRLRSSLTRTTVPSRMRRTTSSEARSRRFQASQSAFTLRQVRLTTSLPTA